eukprot:SAG11_NODE_6473_length_1306_cov_1.274234_1_plen_165_part_00
MFGCLLGSPSHLQETLTGSRFHALAEAVEQLSFSAGNLAGGDLAPLPTTALTPGLGLVQHPPPPSTRSHSVVEELGPAVVDGGEGDDGIGMPAAAELLDLFRGARLPGAAASTLQHQHSSPAFGGAVPGALELASSPPSPHASVLGRFRASSANDGARANKEAG